jgi:hypothetical protein
VKSAKARKDADKTIAALSEIIDTLIRDRDDATAIARSYEEQLVAQRITDDEIAYITDTVLPLLKSLAPDSGDDPRAAQTLEAVEQLLSAEMVTVLQLLGFNFKRAIGEPLTALVGRLIAGAGQQGDTDSEIRLAQIQNNTALLELSQDAEAVQRFRELTGQA